MAGAGVSAPGNRDVDSAPTPKGLKPWLGLPVAGPSGITAGTRAKSAGKTCTHKPWRTPTKKAPLPGPFLVRRGPPQCTSFQYSCFSSQATQVNSSR